MKFTAAAMLGIACLCSLQAQSSKNIHTLRMDRLSKFDAKMQRMEEARTEQWSPQKILVNLNARVPVISVLGYFSAFEDNAQKLQALRVRLQPIAAELALASQKPIYVGTAFPVELVDRMAVLNASLFTAVKDIYGADVCAEVEAFAIANATPALFVE